MRNLTPENIAASCGGKLLGCGALAGRELSFVTTDSRTAGPGALYIPMKGQRDGHDFIPAAMKAGAMLTLTEREEAAAGFPRILVGQCGEAIQRIAEFYRKQFPIPVVGISGSVGKTSTKEMIASVLSQKYKVLKTEGNFNNNLGLPLTVFNLRPEHEIAVLEMGISHFGEMTDLARTARPDTMVITNIGTCHLEFLGDRDGVFRAKTECFPFVSPEGSVVLNGDDDKLSGVREVGGRAPIFYGMSPMYRVYAENEKPLGFKGTLCRIAIDDREFSVRVPFPGRHMVMNALAAAAVGALHGLSDEEIRAGIEGTQALPGRFRVFSNGTCTVIDDCYNANPMSMKASLETLKGASERTLAILGDMGELGEKEEELHYEVGCFAGGLGIDQFVTVGTLGEKIREGILKTDPAADVMACPDTGAALSALPGVIRPGDLVLIKASHFMGFDRLVKALEDKEA
ncbi:MAG: UDP-N-acetylmuramoyl-tripeptide--D-alanyl-D-alanine ligase [Lachnospiraceae bacterium]|nr:UDP-N-acetylmuramoyl-tripeptide--D-alanyl-D-alanine ligase [Lachnospiraceae bacterium]